MRRVLALLLLVSVTLLTACREAKVTSYRVPKEKPEDLPPGMAAASTNAGTVPTPGAPAPPTPGAAMAPGSDMASMAVPTANGSDLSWTAPGDWKPKPNGAMRKGSFTVSGAAGDADLSITAFPGDVGGELANVNRWRGQIQLAPLAEGDLVAVTTHLEQNGLTFVVVDFVSPSTDQPARIVGAIVPFNGATWFFKLMGPDATVAAAKPAFLAFLKTVAKNTATGEAQGAPVMSAPIPSMAVTAVPTAEGSSLAWTAPAHWQPKAPGAMRKGSYDVTGAAGATADLSITAFPGAVGGELANINRWRGQIQLPPIAEADLPAAVTRLSANGLTLIVVDLASPSKDQPVHILGAMVPYGDSMWFFKLMGPDAVVTAEKPAFLAFLQTVKAAAP